MKMVSYIQIHIVKFAKVAPWPARVKDGDLDRLYQVASNKSNMLFFWQELEYIDWYCLLNCGEFSYCSANAEIIWRI